MTGVWRAVSLAVWVGLMVGCGKRGDDAASGRPSSDSVEEAPPPRRVVHLLDEWSSVTSAESVLLTLQPLEPHEGPLGPRRAAGDGWSVRDLPWPPVDGQVTVGGETLEATPHGARRARLLPSARSCAPLSSDAPWRDAFGHEPGRFQLAHDEWVEAPLECAGPTTLRIATHVIRDLDAEWIVSLDGVEVARVPLTPGPWSLAPVLLDVTPGRYLVRVTANERSEPISRRRFVHCAGLSALSKSDALLLSPALGGHATASWRPSRPAECTTWARPALEPWGRPLLHVGGQATLVVSTDAGESEVMVVVDGEPHRVLLDHGGRGQLPVSRDRAAVVHVDVPSLVHQIDWRLPSAPYLAMLEGSLHDDGSTDTLDARAERLQGRFDLPVDGVAGDRRAGYLLPPPSRLAFRLPAGPPRTLRFDVGFARLDGTHRPWSPDAMGEMRLTWQGVDGDTRILWERDLAEAIATVDGEARAWACEVPSDEGTLTVSTDAGASGALPPVVWADPRLIHPDVAQTRPNLLVYLVDTMRADAMTAAGAPEGVTPHLDAIAAQSYRFSHCYSVSSWTRPAIGTLMTGLYPPYHGILNASRPLPDSMVTMAEVLRMEGYSNWAGVTNVQVDAEGVQFEQGFHRFATTRTFGIERPELQDSPSSQKLGEQWIPWALERSDEPFFLYVHSMDPHMPYLPPEEDRLRFAGGYDGLLRDVALTDAFAIWRYKDRLVERDFAFIRAVYDAEVSVQDRAIGELWASLEASGRLEDTVVLFLSDHGEEFHEHGSLSHQGSMWDIHLRVPCVLWVPPAMREGFRPAPDVIDTPVSLVDWMPTLTQLLGVDDPVSRQGRSLLPLLRGEPGEAPPVYAQESKGLSAWIDPPYKLIRRARGDDVTFQLYDLEADPHEQIDLASERPDDVERLWQRVMAAREGWSASHPDRTDVDERVAFSEEELARLRALGYAVDGAPGGRQEGSGE